MRVCACVRGLMVPLHTIGYSREGVDGRCRVSSSQVSQEYGAVRVMCTPASTEGAGPVKRHTRPTCLNVNAVSRTHERERERAFSACLGVSSILLGFFADVHAFFFLFQKFIYDTCPLPYASKTGRAMKILRFIFGCQTTTLMGVKCSFRKNRFHLL